jgi:cell division septation protein DedD
LLLAQDGLKFQDQFKIDITKSKSAIKIDGVLDEETWTNAKETENFWRKWPNDIGLPKRQTYVKMSYDDNFLYIAFKAMDTNYYVAQTLKRDQGFLMSDAGQASMASSIYRAFKSYKSELEIGIVSNDISDADSIVEKQEERKDSPDTTEKTNTAIIPTKVVDTTKVVKVENTKPEVKTSAPKDNPKPEVKNTTPKENPKPKSTTNKIETDYSKLAFITVQVGAIKEGASVPARINELKTVFNITFEDGYTRFFVGKFSTIADAKIRLEKLKNAGFEDAFLTAYDHLVKVKLSEVQNKK